MGNRPHWSHHLLLPCERASAARARVFTQDALNAHFLAHLIDEVQLVVSELASNAVVHAKTPFTVSVTGNSTFLLVGVRDQSPDPVLRGPAVVGLAMAAADARTSGRGLFLVDAFTSTWGVDLERDGGKTVWATFAIS